MRPKLLDTNKARETKKKLGWSGKPGSFLFQMIIDGACEGELHGVKMIAKVQLPWITDEGVCEYRTLYANDTFFLHDQTSIDDYIDVLRDFNKLEKRFNEAEKKLPEIIVQKNKEYLEQLLLPKLPSDNNLDMMEENKPKVRRL